MNYTGLVRWDPAGEKILPDLAESIEISEDARTYTFRRRGIRKFPNAFRRCGRP
jgi:ABC-type transport system substrate-binding protein